MTADEMFTSLDLEVPLANLFATPFLIVDWNAQPVDYVSYAKSTVKIFVVQGRVELATTKQTPVFRILGKVIDPFSAPNYKFGESFVYREILSGIESSCGLRWPRFLGSNQLQNGLHAIWLEEVSGIPGVDWKIEEWRDFALNLAEWHMEVLKNDSLPFGQLRHDDLREWVENDRGKYFPEILDEVHVVANLLNRESIESVKWLWKNRCSLLDRLDALPRTICHNDVWAGNLIKDQGSTDNKYILLDWELTGTGPIGGDLAFAVAAQIWLLIGSIDDPIHLADALLDGYLEGLTISKNDDLLADAKTAYQITAALRWSLMAAQLVLDAKDPTRFDGLVHSKQTTASYILQQRSRLVRAGSKMIKDLKSM